MNYTLTIFLGLFFCISGAFAQNTTVVFNTKENTTIGIGKEIDNAFIPNRISNEQIKTDATGKAVYSWDVDGFQFVDFSFYDGRAIYFPIEQGSHVTITYKGDGEVEFAGEDKAKIDYYLNGYKKGILQPFLGSLSELSDESGYEGISLLVEKYNTQLSNTLDSLETEKTISPKYSGILKNLFHQITTCTAVWQYRTKYIEDSEIKVHGQDSIKVEKLIDGILDKITPMIDSGEIFKHNLWRSVLAIYYTNQYRHLDEKDKEELLSKNAWANYLKPNTLGYLLAPEAIQYKLLSVELLDNYTNGSNEGDSAFISYISKIRPDNVFLPYIKEKQSKFLASMKEDHSEIKYIEDPINALADLSKVGALNQKVLYVDIWATWCGPCIAQFKHKDKLHELLSNYEDIITVYISIDSDADDMTWKARTKTFNLNGYHLRANENLLIDIQEKLFDGDGIGIPRFILMDKDGTILNGKISGPINMDKLKEELDEHLN